MLLPSTFYHIYTHANGSEDLFKNDENYMFFLKKYAHHINPVANTYAYCLMPNHIHFFVEIKDESELLKLDLTGFENLSGLISQSFSNLFNSYSKAYNKMYERKGSLFHRPFKRKPVENDSYFTQIIHYIHANPVHHGFVKHIEDWKYSSYHSFLSIKDTQLKREEVLRWFYSKADFIKFHQQKIDLKLKLEMDF